MGLDLTRMDQLPAAPMGESALARPCRRPRPRLPASARIGCGLAVLLLAGWALELQQPATARTVELSFSSPGHSDPPGRPLAAITAAPAWSAGVVGAATPAAGPPASATPSRPSPVAPPPLPALPSPVAPAAPPAGNGVRPLASPAPVGPDQQTLLQQRVRQQSLAAVRRDPDGWIRRYLLRVTSRCTPQGVVIRAGTPDLAEALRRGPLLISADEAKELFPAYARDPRSRSLYSGAVHEASLLLTDLLWQRALAQPLRPERNLVLFSGGGVASGKTTALRHSEVALGLMGRTEIVQDSTMSDLERARSRIDLALARGRSVQVIYVFTPIELAVRWLVERGMRAGRSVDSSAVARSHWQSQATVLALADRYRDQSVVRFGLLVNGPSADAALRPIDELRPLRAAADPRFPDQASFQRHVEALVRQELRSRHTDADPANPTPELERSLQPRD